MKYIRFTGRTVKGERINSQIPDTAGMEFSDGALVFNWEDHEGRRVERTFNLKHYVIYELLYGVDRDVSGDIFR